MASNDINLKPVEDHFVERYGTKGTPEREQFELEARAFMIQLKC